FFLLLEELTFSRNIAAVAFRKDVLLHGSDRLTRDDLAPDRRLNGDLVHLPWDEFLHFLGELTPALDGTVFMGDERQGIDRFAVQQNIEPHEIGLAIAEQLVIERGIA